MKHTNKLLLPLCLALLVCTLLLSACDKEPSTPGQDGTTPASDTPTDTGVSKENTADDTADQPTESDTEEHVHTFDNWTVITPATCTENGQQEGVCSCGEKAKQSTPATGHAEVADHAIAPTCTEVGLTEGKHCSACNEILVAQQEIEPLGHTEGEWTVTKQETVSEDGEQHLLCSACNQVLKTQSIPATGSLGLLYTVNLDGATCTVIGMGECTDTELYIPAYIDGYAVTHIGENAFWGCDQLTDVILPQTLTVIGNEAFFSCDSLTSIYIPESVTTIEAGAFSSCESLGWVELTEGLKQIGTDAFPTEMFIAFNEYEGAFYLGTFDNPYYALISARNHDIWEAIVHEDCKIIADHAFANCRDLGELTIGQSVTHIGYGAFYYCNMLYRVEIPDSVISIGDNAFYGCSELTQLVIGAGLEKIGERVFESCSSLTSISFPETVTTIGYRAFARCSNLTTVALPSSILQIDDGAFAENGKLLYTKLQGGYYLGNEQNPFLALMEVSSYQSSFTIHEACRVIGGGALSNYSYLESIVIPEGIVSIGEYAFSYCTSLKSITIPDSVTHIGSYAFEHCVELTEIAIPRDVKAIEEYTFYRCTGLTSITLPQSLQRIDNDAFRECETLRAITIPDGVVSIGEYAFYYCIALRELTLPAQLKTIADYAFSDCDSLTDLVIPEGVTRIGYYAFGDCDNLTDVSMPSSIVSVMTSSFSYCHALTLTQYGDGYYLGNPQNPYLVLLYAQGDDTTEITVHPDCRVITDYAFEVCGALETVTIPDTVVWIGDDAFTTCTDLQTIHYEGDAAQWQKLIGPMNPYIDRLSNATVEFGYTYAE